MAPLINLGCASQGSSCNSVAINRDLTYQATLPPTENAAETTLEVCFDTTCDTAKLATSENPNVKGLICQDVDGHTPNFPTTCTFDDATRHVSFTTNTVYGGHAGSSALHVTAISAQATRTEIFHGNVTFQDTSDDTARAACTTAWQGTLAK